MRARRSPDGGKVGCVGYCLGGRLAFMTAARTDIDASVGYYGVGLDGLLGEKHAIARPLMLHIAGADHFVTPTAQALIHEGLDDHPKVTLHDYPGEDHGFAAETGQAAQRGRRRSWPTRAPRTSSPSIWHEMERYRLLIRRTGGPEVLEAEPLGPRRPGRARCWSATRRSGSTSSTPIIAPASIRCRCPSGLGSEGGGRGRGGRRGRQRFRAGRPGRLSRRRRSAPMRPTGRSPPTGWCGCRTGSTPSTAAATMLKGCTAEYADRALRPGARPGRRCWSMPRPAASARSWCPG